MRPSRRPERPRAPVRRLDHCIDLGHNVDRYMQRSDDHAIIQHQFVERLDALKMFDGRGHHEAPFVCKCV